MKIYDGQNNLLLNIIVDDNSCRNRVIMGDHNLTLYYSLPEHIELPVGAYCEFEGEIYTLIRPEQLKMQHKRLYEYTVVFSSEQEKAKIWKFRNSVDRRLKFTLTAKPKEHLQMFIDNMNRRDEGWTIGKCVEDVEKLISYDHDFCWDALSKIASEFKTEFEFAGKCVSLRKVEYNKSNPLPLSYGRGNGFKSGTRRGNSGDKIPTEILFVQGGNRNIDRSKYPESETLRATSGGCLLLPVGQTIGYDGEHFEDEDGYNPDAARHYVVDDLGLSIRNIDNELSTLAEDSLDRSDDYPKRVGTISQVVEVDKDKNFYDFVDSSIPADLNYEDYLIGEEQMTVVFQSGELAGREFDVKYYHEPKTINGKNKAGRRFEIVAQEIDGMMMPGGSFVPKLGDTYAVFNVMLPDAYIRNDTDKSGASWDMFKAAVKYLFDNEQMKFTFTGELDGIWAKKDWLNIGSKIRLGGFILFTDEQFEQEGVLVRITSIKDYINNPHSPKIELSNDTVSASVSSTLKQLESKEVVINDNHQSSLQFTKRRISDTKETIKMVERALSDNFTNSISPIAVETMSLIAGDERLQYQFVESPGSTTSIPHNIIFHEDTKQLEAPAGTVQHLTLGINSISPDHNPDEYLYWNVAEFLSPVLTDATAKYYLYIRAQKQYNGSAGTAVFRLETDAHKLDEEESYYWLLVGVLNSEYLGARSFVTLYGFTEILPGRITADKIISADGKSYFDLANNEFDLGGLFKLTNSSGLWLKSKIELGDIQNNIRRIWSGHNGIFKNGNTIASWWGGPMVDRFYDSDGNLRPVPLSSDYAAALVRMNGSFYFVNGNIGGNVDGSGWLGNYERGIRFGADGSITFGSGIKIALNGTEEGLRETLESILNTTVTITNFFVPCNSSNSEMTWIEAAQNPTSVTSIKAKYSIWTEGNIAAFGSSQLPDGLSTVLANYATKADLSAAIAGIEPGLDIDALENYLTDNSYATQSWVAANFNKYTLTKAAVESVLTGNITTHHHSQYLTFASLNYLNVKDVRDEARPPSYFGAAKMSAWFNNIGTPSTGWYSGIHMKGWSTTYASWELAATSTSNVNNKNLYFRVGINDTWESWQTVLTSFNTKIENGVITINGTSITPLTSHQSLENYVTLDTDQTVTGIKTFSKGIKLRTDSSWVNKDRSIPFSDGNDPATIRWYSTDTDKGLTFNPYTGALKAASFVRLGGSASEFLKADGSVDNNSYALSSALGNYYTKTEINTKLTNGSVTKVGTATVGSSTKPMYLSAGVPTASTSTVGASNKPIYLSGGNLTASSANIGAANLPVWVDNGVIKSVTSVGDAYISWGGENLVGKTSPLDAAINGNIGVNRFAFLRNNGITVEYTEDGQEWLDYEATVAEIQSLFSGPAGSTLKIGKGARTDTAGLRITVDGVTSALYCDLRKIMVNVSTQASQNCYIKVEVATYAAPDVWDEIAYSQVRGWSGWNTLNIPSTWFGQNSSGRVRYIRFTFSHQSVSGNYEVLQVYNIFGFSQDAWTFPSNMARTGHLYNYDALQNATFPADVTANTFVGKLNGVAGKATKLETARTIWGQNFDGSGNVSGNITGAGSINTYLSAIWGSGNAKLNIAGTAANTDFIHLYVDGNGNNNRPLVLQNDYGNVGIGTPTPAYKLDVNGTTRISGTLTIGSITLTDKGGYLEISKTVCSQGNVVAFNEGGSSFPGSPGGGSLFGLMRTWPSSSPGADTTDALGANLGYELYQATNSLTSRVTSLEGKNFLTAITKSQVENVLTGNITSHTHSQYLTSYTDTKNTAGSTNTSSKIFLIGATSQGANPQTYSHDTAYVGTDGCLYSGGVKVLTAHQSLAAYATQSWVTQNFNNYTLPTASASVKGGVKVGSGLSIASDVLSVNLSASHIPSLDWSKIASGKPTTLAGYGITDARIANGVITLGSNSITPVTQSVMETYINTALMDYAVIADMEIYVGSYNAASATKLKTARTIWGQSFNGSGNISGDITNVTGIYPAGSYGLIGDANRQWRYVFSEEFLSNADSGATFGVWGGQNINFIQNGVYVMQILADRTLSVLGDIISQKNITAFSDARLKTEIKDFKARGRLRPRTYIKDGRQEIGFIAQEVREIYPELVIESQTPEKYLALNYQNLTAVLAAQINNHETRIRNLENRLGYGK